MKVSQKHLILLMTVLPLLLFGQKKTYIGAEFGMTRDTYRTIGENYYYLPTIKPTRSFTPSFGIIIGQELESNFKLEVGVIHKNYNHEFNFIQSSIQISRKLSAIQMPLRLRGKFGLFKGKMFITTLFGCQFALFGDNTTTSTTTTLNHVGAHHEGTFINSSGDIVDYYLYPYYSKEAVNGGVFAEQENFALLLESGIGLEFKLIDNMLLNLSANYLGSMRNLVENDLIYYNRTHLTVERYKSSSNGYWNFSIGLNFPINNIFVKEKSK